MHIKTPAADAAALALFMAKGGAVKRVDAADADTMKRTARETYNMLKGEPEVVVVKVARVPSYDAENYAELEAEHYGACAAAGMSGDAATADWNYAKQTRTADQRYAMRLRISRQNQSEADEERGWGPR